MSERVGIKYDPVTFDKHRVHKAGGSNLSLTVIPTDRQTTELVITKSK